MGYTFSLFWEEVMPWKECSVMDERLQFVARRLAGEPMAELCRKFAISRKTGYKIFDRYQECGVQGLTDRSRRPYRYAHQLSFQVENYILNVKREHTTWGARKIRERLIRRFSGIMKCPAEVYQPSTGLDPNKTGAPGETRTPDPLLRSRLSTFIKTCRSERKAEENQQVVTTSDQLLAPSSSPLSRLFAAICHN